MLARKNLRASALVFVLLFHVYLLFLSGATLNEIRLG